ncbi:MAG TPA: hypothetical protein VGM87_02545 [Roseomonas sp.]|jgi:hypothetical protein
MAILNGTLWEGIALRRLKAAADPDQAPRAVALPGAWPDAEAAAAALAAIAPGAGPVTLPGLAERWIRRLEAKGRALGLVTGSDFAQGLRALLLSRRGAPGLPVWRGECRTAEVPRFVLNLSAFLDAGGGFDTGAYAAAVALAVRAAEIAGEGRAQRLSVGFADLAGFLAAHGLRYAGAEGRETAAALAALTLGAAEAESGRIADQLGAREPLRLFWPPSPATCAVPGLAEAARAALDTAAGSHGLRHAGVVALSAPDAVDALLGVETGGMAPAQGHLRPAIDAEGRLRDQPTQAARRAGARAEALLVPVEDTARQQMLMAIGPFLHGPVPAAVAAAIPAAPAPTATPPLPELPLLLRPRRAVRDAMRRVTIGGQRVALRCQEDADGALRGITLTLGRDAGLRALLDATAQAVSVGLARGVPLSDYVDAYAYADFAPAGTVEGDARIQAASSILDWAFRHLAFTYLGRADLADPALPPAPDAAAEPGAPPLLPLDLPALPTPRRARGLRRVA